MVYIGSAFQEHPHLANKTFSWFRRVMIELLKRVTILVVMPLILLMNGGCQTAPEEAVSPESGSGAIAFSGIQPQNVMFGNFEVLFTGRVYDGTSTTFSYSVTGPDRRLYFRLGWNVTECTSEPASWTPVNGTIGGDDCCINPGIEWMTTPVGQSYATHYFSYSFSGDIPEGVVPVSIKCNSHNMVGEIAGPGIPQYLISGNVFQDANANASLDPLETFVSNVTINLLQDGSTVSSTTSDGNGYYEFTALCGTYTVEIDTATLTGTEKDYFVATTALSYEIFLSQDVPGNNFGFDVNTTKLLDDLASEILPTTGFEAKFWKKEFLFAAAGRSFEYTPEELLAFLDTIEGLQLENPFVFPSDDQERLDFVYELLRKPVLTDFEAFERELLTLELNYVSGQGIDLSTQLVLIGWGESLYNTPGGSNPKFGMIQAATIGDATEVYRGINANKSTGGGGTQ